MSSCFLPAEYVAGLRVDLYRSVNEPVSARESGVLTRVNTVTVTAIIDTTTGDRNVRMVPVPEWTRVHASDASAPAVALVVMVSFGVRWCRLVPLDLASPMSHTMYRHGGAFAYLADDRFVELCGGWRGAVAVDDVPR